MIRFLLLMRLLKIVLLVSSKDHNNRLSNFSIVATTVLGVKNMFQNPVTFFVLCATVMKTLYA